MGLQTDQIPNAEVHSNSQNSSMEGKFSFYLLQLTTWPSYLIMCNFSPNIVNIYWLYIPGAVFVDLVTFSIID
jgi:hypothetical protein